SQPALQRRRFFKGTPMQGSGEKDIMWLSPSGEEMTGEEWNQDHVKCLGVRLSGAATGEVDERGRPRTGDTLAYLLNAGDAAVDFIMPSVSRGRCECLLDTYDDERTGHKLDKGKAHLLAEHSMALFVKRGTG